MLIAQRVIDQKKICVLRAFAVSA